MEISFKKVHNREIWLYLEKTKEWKILSLSLNSFTKIELKNLETSPFSLRKIQEKPQEKKHC